MTDSNDFSEAVKAGKTIVLNNGNTRLWFCSAKDEERVALLKTQLGISKREGVNIWVDNDSRLNQHTKDVSEAAWDVFDATDGEITLILPHANNIAKSALFEDQSAAITFVKEPWTSSMMKWMKSPLAVIKSQDGKEDIPLNLQKDVYVLNLAAQINQIIFQGHSIIKLSNDGGIKIIRNQGQKLVPHI